MSIALTMYDPLLAGNGPLGNYAPIFFPTWRRSVRRRGGCWIGTIELTEAELTKAELEEFFRYGILREIRETGGGQETWRGALMKMEYQRGAQLFTTDMTRMSNAVAVMYTRIFDNLLTNGSGESGVWAAYGSPTTLEQSTAWYTDGRYSIHIIVSGGITGAVIQATTTIVANRAYTIEGNLRVVSGSWRVESNRTDTNETLAYFSTRGGAPGDYHVTITIPDTNTYAGTVTLTLTVENSAGEIYADGFSFRFSPLQAQTGWYQDDRSIAIHGRKENVILEVGKSDAAANAQAQTYLSRFGWPVPFPPTNATTLVSSGTAGDKLKLTFAGYWATLNWLYITLAISSGYASDLVTALAGLQSTYLSVGTVESNLTSYNVDQRGPLKLGDTLKDIAGDGKAGGQLYGVGVYGRTLDYLSVPAELTYYLRGGQLYSTSGVPYEPWLARPGYALWQDLPISPGAAGGNAQNDPRWVYLEEIEMLPPSADAPYGNLTYNLEEMSV